MNDPDALLGPQRCGRRRPAPEGARRPAQARAGVASGRATTLDAARSDPDLRELLPELEERLEQLEEDLKLALVERDPNDAKDVIVEIRQGAGGDEAALWAGDLFRMLTRYAERRGLQVGAARLEPERRRRLQGRDLRDQGRRRLLRVQVRGRDAPRAARARDGVAGPHPHVDGDRRGHARGGGGRRRARRERPEDRRLPLDGPRRPERQHDRLGGADHAPPDRDRRGHAGREVPAPEQAEGDARPARTAPRGELSASRRSSRHSGARRSAAAIARRRSAPTTSPRTASPTTASSSRSTGWTRFSTGTSTSSPKRSRPRSAGGRSRPRQRVVSPLDAVHGVAQELDEAGVPSPRVDAELLVAEVLGVSRSELYASRPRAGPGGAAPPARARRPAARARAARVRARRVGVPAAAS